MKKEKGNPKTGDLSRQAHASDLSRQANSSLSTHFLACCDKRTLTVES